MDDPPNEITHIIHLLTQSPPTVQRNTIEQYYTPTASFTHPFCRTGSFKGSRWLIWCVFRWYKILSPRIELAVESVCYDEKNLILYVGIHQLFKIWAVPFWRGADVRLVTVLTLVREGGVGSVINGVEDQQTGSGGGGGGQTGKLRIQSQNDLYQVNEFVKFVSVFGILNVGVYAWQLFATLLCVLGAGIGYPISWVEERAVGGNQEKSLKEIVKG